ncbi:MAG: YdbL family protein [Gammaproteobacteria bacterium]|jgi:uncharacterized protein YdbL (DUF1318 family)
MKSLRLPLSLLPLLFAAACVTINVYFPAEAAEEAADRIIRDVYGEQPAPPGESEPRSQAQPDSLALQQGGTPLDWLIPPVQAAADITVDTPAIRQLKAAMEARHRQLAPFYASGAVGISHDGQLVIRDQKLVPLKDRNSLSNLVAKENRDRNALYKEIARANSHPDWEAEIRETFARRWVDNARKGWWYQDSKGDWKQK